MPNMKNIQVKIPAVYWILFLIAVAVYLPGFWWGAPYVTAAAPEQIRSWGTDDLTPLGPLADLHNLIEPKPDRNLAYPLMHSFIVAAAYAPYLAFLWLTGGMTSISATYPYGLVDPVGTLKILTYISHLISVFMGAGIVVAAYDTGRTLWNHRTGLIAALLTMVSFPMFYYSRTGNVDIPMQFFLALALAFFARILTGGLTVQRAVWLGIFAGLAAGTKEQAAAAFLALPLILLPLHWRKVKDAVPLRSLAFWKAPVAAGIAVFLAFGFGSGLFISPERFFAHIEFARQRMSELDANSLFFIQAYPRTPEGNLALTRLLTGYLVDIMTLPGLFLAGLGLLWIGRKEPLKATFVLPAVTYLLVLFFATHSGMMRYLMPAAYILTFFTARILAGAWESRQVVLRTAAVVLALGIFSLNLLRGVDLTYAMLNDSRYAAAEWMQQNTLSGDRAEYLGISWSLPPLKEGVTISLAVPFDGVRGPLYPEDQAAEKIRIGWQERRPELIVIVPDYTVPTGIPYSAACPPEIYSALLKGELGYQLAAHFETQTLLPWVQRPKLDYPTVNPPIRIFVPVQQANQP
jgi:hypothetical protein